MCRSHMARLVPVPRVCAGQIVPNRHHSYVDEAVPPAPCQAGLTDGRITTVPVGYPRRFTPTGGNRPRSRRPRPARAPSQPSGLDEGQQVTAGLQSAAADGVRVGDRAAEQGRAHDLRLEQGREDVRGPYGVADP